MTQEERRVHLERLTRVAVAAEQLIETATFNRADMFGERWAALIEALDELNAD